MIEKVNYVLKIRSNCEHHVIVIKMYYLGMATFLRSKY